MRLRCPRIWLLIAVLSIGCEREERRFRETVPPGPSAVIVPSTSLEAGPARQGHADFSRYERNAHAISEGQRLYEWFNCSGCHARGGGAIGPALMDDTWVYGGEPAQIFATLVEGRPNGMPAFGPRVPDQQLWQIVAYVRSMSGQVRKDVAPGRTDTLQMKPAEQSAPAQPPRRSSPPPGNTP